MKIITFSIVVALLVGCEGNLVWYHQVMNKEQFYVYQYDTLEECHEGRKKANLQWGDKWIVTKCKPGLHEKYRSVELK